MHAIMIAAVVASPLTRQVELPRDVHELHVTSFALPLALPAELQPKVDCLRLFVSDDKGRSWTRMKDCKPTRTQVAVTAPGEGLYWFGVQIVFKDGKKEPAEVDDVAPQVKVYVNTERRALKVQKSYAELVEEAQELRKTVQELRKKVAELEAKQKPK